MGKKRKQVGNVVAAEIHKEEDEVSKQRLRRTLQGWKRKEEDVVSKQRLRRTLQGWKHKEEDVVGKEVGSRFRNKEKVIVTCSHWITYRYRHLMQNIISLLPHCKKENKIKSREIHRVTLNEMVELRNCSFCLFFECRKLKDLYIWMGKSPNGPSVKFLVNAVHTMEELKLTDDHIWFRNFQIADQGDIEKTTLVEVGPRFCLNPVRIFAGSFGGPMPYENPLCVSQPGSACFIFITYGTSMSPLQIRALEKKQKAGKYAQKIKAKTRRMHEMSYPLEGDELANIWRE